MARPNCLRLLEHFIRAAASRTFWTAGSSSPIRIAMMAITTSSSIRVNPRERFPRGFIGLPPHCLVKGEERRKRIGRDRFAIPFPIYEAGYAEEEHGESRVPDASQIDRE